MTVIIRRFIIDTQEIERKKNQTNKLVEQIAAVVLQLHTSSNTLYLATFGSLTCAGGNDIDAFTIHIQNGNCSF